MTSSCTRVLACKSDRQISTLVVSSVIWLTRSDSGSSVANALPTCDTATGYFPNDLRVYWGGGGGVSVVCGPERWVPPCASQTISVLYGES